MTLFNACAIDMRQVGYIVTKLFGVVDLPLEDQPYEQASLANRLRSTIKRNTSADCCYALQGWRNCGSGGNLVTRVAEVQALRGWRALCKRPIKIRVRVWVTIEAH